VSIEALMTRRVLISNGAALSANQYLKTSLISKPHKMNILIVGFGSIGHSFVNELVKKQTRSRFHLVSTTTKPKRVQDLKEMVDEVILIPQLMTPNNDFALQEGIRRADVIIICDAIRMFSVHSFHRTALRISEHMQRVGWNGFLCVMSSENAYGSVLHGENVDENACIFPNIRDSKNSNLLWHVNPMTMASVIRSAEMKEWNPLIVRSAGIWDTTKFNNAFLFTSGNSFPSIVGDSYFSFCTATIAAKFLLWGIDRNKRGIYNLAASGCLGLTRRIFYERVHSLYGSAYVGGVNWVENMGLDFDSLYSMDPDPFLPCSQRSNSQLNCSKAMRDGFYY